MSVPDPATQSNFLEIVTKHLHLDWVVDWQKKIISGSVTHQLLSKSNDVKEIVFDTSYLAIEKVQVNGQESKYTIESRHKVLGSALRVHLVSPVKGGETVDVCITYSTTDECTAVGWLDKDQTAGKSHPYLYSQCQAIHARSLLPVQDTPAVKITYSADVSSVLPALMSALRVSPSSDQIHDGKEVGVDVVQYKYDQPVPIPSYLIAIASGNLAYRSFPDLPGKSWRTGVWTEPELMDASYWEFSKDTAKFLATAEEIVGDYEFGVYDLLLLPPSFPFGGMENANLTFATPTLLAGDRSLVDVVAHEISHSWFGNNVGCANWCDFWLNEGWTTYLERLLLLRLHGPAARDFSYIIGRKGLTDDLKGFEGTPKYQRLYIPYDFGEDPDEAFSRVPYDKGSNFLLHIERSLGGLEVFLPYVKDYVTTFRGTSITTNQWKSHLYEYFQKNGGDGSIKILESLDWDGWLSGEGLTLPVDMKYDTTLANEAYVLAERWDKSRDTDAAQLQFRLDDLKGFDSNQKVVFLERLHSLPPLPSTHIKAMHEVYAMETASTEIALRFYELAMESKLYADEAADWVVGKDTSGSIKGRMKFCRPIFRAIAKVDKELAMSTWQSYRKFFHPIARGMIDKDLGLQT